MNIYHYNPKTGELIAADIAREDPLLPGQFRLPAFATIDPAPLFIATGHAAAYLDDAGNVPADYRNGAWREVIDQRGEYWRTDNGLPVTLDRLGVTPTDAGLTRKEPPAFGKWTGKAWKVDQKAAMEAKKATIRAQISEIEQIEQPSAQRAFALTGDNTAMRAIQEKIDALLAQIQE